MPKNFSCRPPRERDGIWIADRFYGTPADAHYESTVQALHRDGLCPEHVYTPPRKFRQLEGLKSEELQFPFTMHDNRYQHEYKGENLRGTYRKARPCCMRHLHKESDPAAYVDNVDPPSSTQRLQTIARETYLVPSAAAVSDVPSGEARRYRHESSCPFLDGSCRHQPALQRRCEPVSSGPPAAAAAAEN